MQPTGQPSAQPTRQPTSQPTAQPSAQPLGKPVSVRSRAPLSIPSASPEGKTTSPSKASNTSSSTFAPSAIPSSLINVTELVKSNRKFYSEPGPMAGFIIGSVVVLGLLILSAYYCVMSSLGYKGLGPKSIKPVAADGSNDKNILI